MTLGRAFLLGLALVAILSASVPAVLAQSPATDPDDDRERGFVEALRREDPASAERYVALRDARRQAMAALQKAQQQYAAAGPELRPLVVRQLQDAQRQYAKTSIAFLDFLDARDRRFLTRYQEEIGRINKVLEEHARARAELEKQLREP
ncbi:MAG TPA: hypothetical protein VJZ73_21130 [Methylomirabilota bacterium]|nr:hypothetical protein [Methylomirabilota bacterium]